MRAPAGVVALVFLLLAGIARASYFRDWSTPPTLEAHISSPQTKLDGDGFASVMFTLVGTPASRKTSDGALSQASLHLPGSDLDASRAGFVRQVFQP